MLSRQNDFSINTHEFVDSEQKGQERKLKAQGRENSLSLSSYIVCILILCSSSRVVKKKRTVTQH